MAKVYRAFDLEKRLPIALKVLSPEMSLHDGARTRFHYEAKTMASLRHPNIVQVFDIGEDDGRLWIAMELLSEGSVADFIRSRGPMSPDHAVNIMAGVLSGLEVAHAQRITHRDIKPENVLLGEVLSVAPMAIGEGKTMWHVGMPKITDFGIARIEERTHALTMTGSIMGTWAYMAPEQRADATSVDGRTDLFACGAMLCAMLTGKPPHDLTTQEVRERLGRDLPDSMAAVIRRATRYHPEDRYQSAQAMREHLLERARSMDLTPSSYSAINPVRVEDEVTFSLDLPPQTTDVPSGHVPRWAMWVAALVGGAFATLFGTCVG
jgi:serine/threonine-protein kinase